jgi:hypothetical protein
MNEQELEILKRIDSKLGALIALEMVEDKPSTNREKIKLLSDLGLNYNDIASILNANPGYVSKEKALLKKKNG